MMNFIRDLMPIVKEVLAKNGLLKLETEMKKNYFQKEGSTYREALKKLIKVDYVNFKQVPEFFN